MERGGLAELAVVLLRLGLTAFGGPAAHIALFRDEFVRRRGWLSDGEYLDLIGAANLIPGPNSTEVAIHLGYRRAGRRGLLVAGVAFILPAFLIVLALAWAYVATEGRPDVAAVFAGIAPVVVAIVAHAGLGLVRSAAPTVSLAAIVAGALIGAIVGIGEIPLLAAGGLAALALHVVGSGRGVRAVGLLVPEPLRGSGALGGGAAAVAAATAAPTLVALFVSMLTIGAVLYGSGYVLITLLRSEFVETLAWITEQQLLDAVAIGQVTPGPLFTSATFVGYLALGVPGAIVATVGIFLPAFAYVVISAPILPRLRRLPVLRAALNGVNAAAVGLIIAVALLLARSAIVDPLSAATAVVALALLWRTGVGTGLLILAGGLIGVVHLAVGV